MEETVKVIYRVDQKYFRYQSVINQLDNMTALRLERNYARDDEAFHEACHKHLDVEL